MTRTDKTLLALNAGLALLALIGFASTDLDTLMVGALLTTMLATANAVMAWRRRDGTASARRRHARAVDEMDAATVLDLDARLEALERAQHADTERLRALAGAGAVSAPAADPDKTAAMPTARRERV